MNRQWVEALGDERILYTENDGGLSFRTLGSINEEGFLPCGFCWKYPVIRNDFGFYNIEHIHTEEHTKIIVGGFKDKQALRDEWNKRE